MTKFRRFELAVVQQEELRLLLSAVPVDSIGRRQVTTTKAGQHLVAYLQDLRSRGASVVNLAKAINLTPGSLYSWLKLSADQPTTESMATGGAPKNVLTLDAIFRDVMQYGRMHSDIEVSLKVSPRQQP